MNISIPPKTAPYSLRPDLQTPVENKSPPPEKAPTPREELKSSERPGKEQKESGDKLNHLLTKNSNSEAATKAKNPNGPETRWFDVNLGATRQTFRVTENEKTTSAMLMASADKLDPSRSVNNPNSLKMTYLKNNPTPEESATLARDYRLEATLSKPGENGIPVTSGYIYTPKKVEKGAQVQWYATKQPVSGVSDHTTEVNSVRRAYLQTLAGNLAGAAP